MATNGPVAVQGCAVRITRLNADGSCSTSSVGMIQDDRSFVKLEAKPDMDQGVEFTPKSACGVPVISYKDCDRYKRWDVTLTMGDWDPEMMELVGQGSILTAEGSAGRTFADGAIAVYSNILTSPADAVFVPGDVGRSVSVAGVTVADCALTLNANTITTTAMGGFTGAGIVEGMPVTGTDIPAGTTVLFVLSATEIMISAEASATVASETLTFGALPVGTAITEFVSATEVRMSGTSFIAGTGLSVTLGSEPVATIGYQYPHLLLVNCPYGVSIEVWSKAIVRGTGYQGTTPYPSSGTPTTPGSAYIRTGVFRAYLWHEAWSIENKEQTPMFTGWAIENPNFGTGPNDDWRQAGLPDAIVTSPALDTTAWCDMMADFQLPSPLQPGYQTPPY